MRTFRFVSLLLILIFVLPLSLTADPANHRAITVVGIRIMRDGKDVTGKTLDVYAGEKISLTAKVPSGIYMIQSVWYLRPDGHPIANWTPGDKGYKTLLSQEQLSSKDISYY